jgi:hypothetical protein
LIISANSRGPVLYQREREERSVYLQISMAVSKTKNLTDPKKKRVADHCDKTLSKLFNSGTTNSVSSSSSSSLPLTERERETRYICDVWMAWTGGGVHVPGTRAAAATSSSRFAPASVVDRSDH